MRGCWRTTAAMTTLLCLSTAALAQTGTTPRKITIDAMIYGDAIADAGQCPHLVMYPPALSAPGGYDYCDFSLEAPVAFGTFGAPCTLFDDASASYATECSSSSSTAVVVGSSELSIRFDNNEIEMEGFSILESVLEAHESGSEECEDPTFAEAMSLTCITGRTGPAATLVCPFGVRQTTSGSLLVAVGPVMWPAAACYGSTVSLTVSIKNAGGSTVASHTITLNAGDPADSDTIPVTLTAGRYTMTAAYSLASWMVAEDGCTGGLCGSSLTEFENLSFTGYLLVGDPYLRAE